ncbi:uncharacterized protein METZ01_LOCUS211815 [marine metagenome]|uniref:Uncharacterized protein n=1 Tax=marine metagenome TaxID=408172 RepID=A0A382FA57_9ZZZZ
MEDNGMIPEIFLSIDSALLRWFSYYTLVLKL